MKLLLWWVAIGDDFEFLTDIQAQGERVKKLEDKPELPPWLFTVWNDYGYLIGGRNLGFGVGPIPPNIIIDYAKLMHPSWSIDDIWEFLHMVSHMDRAHRKVTKKDD